MKVTSISLPSELTDQVDQIARDADRSRSWVLRNLLQRALSFDGSIMVEAHPRSGPKNQKNAARTDQ